MDTCEECLLQYRKEFAQMKMEIYKAEQRELEKAKYYGKTRMREVQKILLDARPSQKRTLHSLRD